MTDRQGSFESNSSATGRIATMAWSVFNKAFLVVAVVLVIAAASLIVVPKALGWTGIVVLSGSMEPELKTGGIAFIDEVDTTTLKAGDVITFRPFTDQNNMVTHRIIEVQDTANGLHFVTKGDANSDADLTPVADNQVVGEVQYHLPYAGHLVDKLNNRNNYYLIVGIPAALLILNEIGSLYTEFRKTRSRKGMSEPRQEAEGASS